MSLNDKPISFRRIFITVGSFKFDKLINKLVSENILTNINYEQVIIQYGRGCSPNEFNTYIKFIEMTDETQKNWEYLSSHGDLPSHGCFNLYKNSATFFKLVHQADLIITHGGAGTLLDLIRDTRNNSHVVAVSNPDLLNNHQVHLIKKLSSNKFIAAGLESPDELTIEQLSKSKSSTIEKIPPANTKAFLKDLEMLTGYSFQ